MKPHELIAALMRAQKLGALPLAKKMHLPKLQPSIYRFMRGEIASPAATTAVPLAKFFGLPLEAIYDEKVSTRIGRERDLKVVEPLPARKSGKKAAEAAGAGPEFDESARAVAVSYSEMDAADRAQVDRLCAQIAQKLPHKKQA